MKLGIQETSLGPQTFRDTWRLTQEAGLDGLNLCYVNKPDISVLGNLDYAIQIEDMVRTYKVAVCGMYLGYLMEAPFLVGEQTYREEGKRIVRRALTVASRIGAPTVVVPLDGANGVRSKQHDDAVVASLQELARDAVQAEVDIAVDGPLPSEQVRELLTRVGSTRVKLCYDTGDAAVARVDSIGLIRRLGPNQIGQVHLKDVNLAAQPPDCAVRLGRGDVRFDAVMFALRSVMYDGWVVLQTPPGDVDGQIVALHADDARSIITRGLHKQQLQDSPSGSQASHE